MPQEKPMNIEQMQDTAMRLKLAKGKRDVQELQRIYHPQCQIDMPSVGFSCKGHAALMMGFAQFATTFPDYDRELAGSALDGDTFVSWGPAKVTLTGTFGKYQSTGERSTVMTFVLFRFAGEQIVHESHYWDMATICRAAGVPVEELLNSLRSSPAAGVSS
jgi:SnoaL-like polyketide cyclase